MSFPEKCTEPGDDLSDCQTGGYIAGRFEQPSTSCPARCSFSAAGYPGAASARCLSCIQRDVERADGIQWAELMLAGTCFPEDAVWGTRCTSADAVLVRDSIATTHPSASCWMCMTKAQLDNPSIAEPLAPCINRLSQGTEEREQVAIAVGRGMNRDSYCEQRIRQDALANGIPYEHACMDSACCHWDREDRPPICRSTESVGLEECPLATAFSLNSKTSAAAAAAAATAGGWLRSALVVAAAAHCAMRR